MAWQANPVLVKELRSRMRGPRAFVFLSLSLVALAGVCGLVYAVEVDSSSYGAQPDLGAVIGRTLFGVLAVGETLLVAGLAPSISAGAISREDEHKTLELLLVTPLKYHTILWGKLLSSLAYVGLVVLAAVPLASLVLLFGGVSPGEMFLALGLLAVFALTFATLGLFCSIAIQRTGWARGVALSVILFLMGGSAFLAGTLGILLTIGSGNSELWFLVPNPIVAMLAIIVPDIGLGSTLPLWAYTAGGYAIWTGLLYGGSLLLLRRRRGGVPEQRSRRVSIITMIVLGLLTLCGLCGLPLLLAQLGTP